MPAVAAPRKASARLPEWATTLKKVPIQDFKVLMLPDLSVVEGDVASSAEVVNVKVVVRPAPVRLLGAGDEWKRVPVKITDLSCPTDPTSVFTDGVWVNLKGGEFPHTFVFPPRPDAKYEPDFSSEVEVEVDPDHTIPEINLTNNKLRLWGTNLG